MKLKDFMSSLSYDIRLLNVDIKGSIAHVRMLKKCGIIDAQDAAKIIAGLQGILKDVKCGKPLPDEEDVHMAVEKELIKRIGSVGGKLHTARSRNDQVALDIRMYLKECIGRQTGLLINIQKEIVGLAKKNKDIIVPAMTHLQHAQPVLLSHHLLAYAWMFQRDKDRLNDCLKRIDVSPLGAAACAGTSFPIDRVFAAKQLGFSSVVENSMDAVSERDFVVEYLSGAALIMVHISRLAEELIIWSSQEFSFVSLGDAYTSGSSIMPQKKNPDFAEIIRSKTGRVFGSLMGMLTVLKGLPLTYNRDLQEDKPLLFDTVDTIDAVCGLTGSLIPTLTFNKKKMRDACATGYMEATELADYLVRKGLPFREAHGTVKKIVKMCLKKGRSLTALTLKDLKKFSRHFDEDAVKQLTPEAITASKRSRGGTAQVSVEAQIKQLQKLIS